MPSQTTANDRLDGWEAIADYLGWTPRTAIRWEKMKGLPVHRVPGGKRQPVYAFRHEIDEWYGRTSGNGSMVAIAASPAIAEPHASPQTPSAPVAVRRLSRSAIFTV